MTDRLAPLDRLLSLVHRLADAGEGLTLDEMAAHVGVDRRTAERMRNVIGVHFPLDDHRDERKKRFRIRDSLRRVFSRPTAAELAALAAEVEATAILNPSRSAQLASMLAKVTSAFDDREKLRLAPDLEALRRLQRVMPSMGPVSVVPPDSITTVQSAILAGHCVEFSYTAAGRDEAEWRRVVPYGLIHGAQPYLVGQLPSRAVDPTTFRFDRMRDVRVSDVLGVVPDNWDLDRWMAGSVGVWRDDAVPVALRIKPHAAERGRAWRFHPSQSLEELGDGSLRICFKAGGQRELAEHLFSGAGDLVIEGPAELRETMRDRLASAKGLLR